MRIIIGFLMAALLASCSSLKTNDLAGELERGKGTVVEYDAPASVLIGIVAQTLAIDRFDIDFLRVDAADREKEWANEFEKKKAFDAGDIFGGMLRNQEAERNVKGALLSGRLTIKVDRGNFIYDYVKTVAGVRVEAKGP